MMTLVTGASGSGKSEFAERLVTETSHPLRFYVATMRPWDEECKKRIERHREMRREKQFVTYEAYGSFRNLSLPETKGIVLLECLSNYVTNLCFETEQEEEILLKQMEQEILYLKGQTAELVIVTNEVFSDGLSYTEEVRRYLRLLGGLNVRLAARADAVAEVVYGIPIWQKGGR